MYQYRISNDDAGLQGAEDDSHSCHNSCDSKSARALKRILSLIDDLNDQDLRILEDIIERLLCSRS